LIEVHVEFRVAPGKRDALDSAVIIYVAHLARIGGEK